MTTIRRIGCSVRSVLPTLLAVVFYFGVWKYCLFEDGPTPSEKLALKQVRTNQFIESAERRDYAEVERLLNEGIQVDSPFVDPLAFFGPRRSGYTALMGAATNGDIAMIQLLLKRGADPNVTRRNRNAWYFAAIQGHRQAARVLERAGAIRSPELNFPSEP